MSVVSASRACLPSWKLSVLICLLGLFCYRLIPTRAPPQSPQKAGVNGVWINLVLDESGSMEPVTLPTIDTINKYIADQKEACTNVGSEPGAAPMKCHVSLTKFSDISVRPVFNRFNIQDTKPLQKEQYTPGGNTNLLDAIGETITKIDDQLAQSSDDIASRPAVLVVIMTDGEENNSYRYRTTDIREMISTRQTMGWTFVFLGANIDAWATAKDYGISGSNSFKYNVHDQESILSSISGASSRYIYQKSAQKHSYGSAAAAEKAAAAFDILYSGVRDAFFSQDERDQYESKY